MSNDSLAGLLADRGIRLKSQHPGHTEHAICSKCGGGTQREACQSVTVDEDGQGFAWICHRATCGDTGGARVPTPGFGDRPRGETRRIATLQPPKAFERPQPHSKAISENVPQWLFDFFGEREIGMRTIKAFGVYAATQWFPGPQAERDAIVLPYFFNGELVNRKYRTRPPEKTFAQDKDALPTLFNIDRVSERPEEITFCEGELDCMALFECQIEGAVSLKDGAPKEATFKADDKRFEALRTHADVLSKVKKIILAGDMDVPGLALREELARRLGRHKCHLVTWPDGCKDACDTLRIHGTSAVQEAFMNAAPYPISGLQRITPEAMIEYMSRPPQLTMTTGAKSTNAIVGLPTEGRLIIVTGTPGSGKTTWTRFVMIHTMKEWDRKWAVFSPEMSPWQAFVEECFGVWSGKATRNKNGSIAMSKEEATEASLWFGTRLTPVTSDTEAEEPTIDWLIEKFSSAVLRDGVTDILIDPWNEVVQTRGGMTETDFIGVALQKLKAFGLRYGCNIWIVAHPAKPPPLRSGDAPRIVGPYDISGSSHWANKTDLGITVHSTEWGCSEVHIWKSRFSRFGSRGASAKLVFDQTTGRYSDPTY